MGDAKRNREELRKRMLVELERLMAPTSPDEERLNDEIRTLDFYSISRAPDEQLAYGRMKPQQCHQNAGSYARLDPSGRSRHVSGWWKRGEIFYFHSVVFVQGRLFCVTPNPDRAPLKFAPDYDIKWHEAEGKMDSLRRGREVPYLVRDFPDKVIAGATAAHDELMSGADPRTLKLVF